MKKTFLLFILAFGMSYLGWGQLLVENFDYTVGTLLTANGWTAHSGTTNFIMITASSITYPGYISSGVGNEVTMTTSGEDDNKAFTSQNTGSLYASFIVNVTSAQTTGDYFAHFAAQSGSSGVTTFAGRVWVKKDPASSNFAFGISKSSTAGNQSYSGYSYSIGTTYLVVVKYTFVSGPTNDVAVLFINPVLNSTEPSPTISTLAADNATSDPAQLLSYCLRQGSTSAAPALKLDGIRVGLTWADVVNGTVAAPTTQATNVSFTNVTSSGLTTSWTNGNGSNRAVFMKQANTGTASPVNNTTYTASTIFGSGTEITGTGWFCIYNGTGTTVNVTGLAASTDYIVMVCEYNGTAGGEQYNTNSATGNPNMQTTLAAVSPTLTATPLNDFGNVCISATGGPESFTINGTNLTTDNVTIAALDGYAYSTSIIGPYTSTLSLPQPGGTYSQDIYVMFSPLLVQSYNGNFAVGGGGAGSINVSVTGAGVNTSPSVNTDIPATDIGLFSATCYGDVTSEGCQGITERGICYGTSFAPTIAGAHTIEPGSTGSFISNLTGLNPNTLYHFRAYATSSAGTSYGTDQTFTTLNLDAPAATDATNISSTGFTANWNAVTGATGYYLDVYTVSSGTLASDLFISEYVEGSSSNKYIELFNGTGATKDLSDYKLQLYTNGSAVVSTDVVLSGTLLSGQTIVYKNSLAAIYGGTAYVNSAVNYNGNDAVALYKISTLSYADIFGTIGENPGTAWISGSYTTLDKTLVRKSTVTGGVTINPAPGFPTLGTEWDQYNQDDVSHLGSHTFAGATVTYVISNLDVGDLLTYDIPSLTPNTLYHYVVRAYYGTATSPNSNVIDVTTYPAEVLTVTTEPPTAITSSTATGNGTIVGIGSSTPTARGFCWDLVENPDPDINSSKVEETGSFGPGAFTGNITLLLDNTYYKVRAYATNAEGTSYGEVQSFVTMKQEPSNHATNFTAGTTTTTTIPLNWIDAAGPIFPDAYLIKGSTTSFEAIVDPVDGTPEANSALVQNVPQWVEAYTFENLSPATPYYFKIYSYTNSGSGTDYKLGTISDPTPMATATTLSLPAGALLYESFDYAAGDFIGGNTGGTGGSSNNWITHSNGAAATGTIDVLAGSLSYTGLSASVGNKILLPGNNATVPRDVNRAIPSNTNTVMYFSALINVVDNTQLATAFSDNSYFLYFSNTAGASAATFYARLHIKSTNAGANYRFGIQNTTGGTPTQTEFPTDLSFGTTYLVVVKYDFNGLANDVATLWVDPISLGGTEPPGSVADFSGTGTGPTTYAAICLRNSTATPKAEIDEIRIGNTWADVTPPGEVNKTLNLTLFLEGLYNGTSGFMNQAQGASGPQFGTGIADQVTVELHDALSPYGIAYTYSNVDLNTNGTLAITTIPGTVNDFYYVVIKHRNSIETWSSTAVSFDGLGPIVYDFSSSASQAFGNNMKQFGAVYAIYGGDATQDGSVDGSDMAAIDNASTILLAGYNPEDINGDGIVDGSDMALIDNNSTAIIHAQTP